MMILPLLISILSLAQNYNNVLIIFTGLSLKLSFVTFLCFVKHFDLYVVLCAQSFEKFVCKTFSMESLIFYLPE